MRTVALILLIVFLAGCGEQNKPPAPVTPSLTTGKLGLWINPKDADMQYYDEALSQAREAHIQVAHLYVQWGMVEKSRGKYDWAVPDYILGKFDDYGFEPVVVIPIIFTTKLDVMPQDVSFTRFSDPAFVERFVQFTRTLTKRYPQIQYLIVGNEIDVYLCTHPDAVEDFGRLVEAVADACTITVGTEVAIHSVVQTHCETLIQKALTGDMVFYTFYPMSGEFSFAGDPQKTETYFDAMENLAKGRKIAVVETSWSSSPSLESSEEKQAEYVRELFSILKERREKIEFLMWITLHDSTPEECRKSAEFFVKGVQDDVLQNTEVMNRFSAFMCFLGLRQVDGTPKKAWYEWMEQVKQYESQ